MAGAGDGGKTVKRKREDSKGLHGKIGSDPTLKLSSRDDIYGEKNAFRQYKTSRPNSSDPTPNYSDPTPNAYPLISHQDPNKLLALLAAFLGLFTNHSQESHDSGSAGKGSGQDPKKILVEVAVLLGLCASAATGTPRINNDAEDGGNCRRSKRLKSPRGSDATSTCQKEFIPDPSFSTPPAKSRRLACGDSPASGLSSASVDCTTTSSGVKFPVKRPLTNENILEDKLLVHHESVEHPSVQAGFDSVKATLEPILLQTLTRVRIDELTVESGLETAASIHLLKLLNASNHGLVHIGERARRGAMLLEEGQKKVNEGKNMLFSAISDIPKQIK